MRITLKVVPLVFLLAGALVACDSTPSGPTASAERATNVQDLTKHNAADAASLAQQFKTVREATKKYRDVAVARADGYIAISPYVPGMGFHFAAGSPFGTTLDAPGVLVYFTNSSYNPSPGELLDPAHDDDLILGAVEYLVPGNQSANPPNIFADEQSPRALRVSESEGWHYESTENFTGLHAWIYRGNADGVFHPTNPTID